MLVSPFSEILHKRIADKRQIAMGQRGMYISVSLHINRNLPSPWLNGKLQMLGHAGLLDFRDTRLPIQDCQANPEMAWAKWKEHEGRSRYSNPPLHHTDPR